MKGLMGIWIAVALGILGAFCNWFYIAQEAARFERENFIAISDSRAVNPGDKFSDSDFVQLPIPKGSVGNLEKSAVKWTDLNTAVGQIATRAFEPGQILLRSDLEQPPPPDVQSNLGPGELAMWVPMDTRSVVPSLLKAGDYVSFIVASAPPAPTPVGAETAGPAPAQHLIGPYRILAMGNRLGSAEKLRAYGNNITQENMMAIAVKIDPSGELDAAGKALTTALKVDNARLQVLLYKDSPKKK